MAIHCIHPAEAPIQLERSDRLERCSDPTEKEHIFEHGPGKNNGLGLFLVREILFITQIRICENGVEETGARFVIHVSKGTYRSLGRSRRVRS